MSHFTKKELDAFVKYDATNQKATIYSEFFVNNLIDCRQMSSCVQDFKDYIFEHKNIRLYSNPAWPTQKLVLKLGISDLIVIESAWLEEMIKIYQDNFEMQLTLSKILGLFIMCDKFAMARNDKDIVVLDYLDSQNTNDINLNEQLNQRNNQPYLLTN